ncbi:NAD-dependent epimerase/dehydratase family protein [Algisphaera agarilytica]|uniref:Nucleoside-diphosphate-sugar epimerase n=1 Tax=Algisphaera agarilytica TaxID=1385975 RepID=A0A7X0H4Y1_9BACT|nr:NAD(P)-dependent oxidoreductase [Algisphaera agarilytica]MBB6429178.1 nucleoside-diphosphate-sugar epimerase [Algisphaera agarilytica]
MNVLLTGAAGFLGQKLHLPFLNRGHQVLRTDIVPIDCDEPFVQADLSDPQAAKSLTQGVDAMVIAHMSPKNEQDPSRVFTTMGVGTINLFQAAADAGIRKVCLISSVDAVRGYPKDTRRMRSFPPKADELYGLGKASQEHIAEYYARLHGLEVTVLRIGYVIDATTLTNKYDVVEKSFAPNMVDRLDVGEACARCLQRKGKGYEVFYVLGIRENGRFEVEPTWEALDWHPQHLAKPTPMPQIRVKAKNPKGFAQPAT